MMENSEDSRAWVREQGRGPAKGKKKKEKIKEKGPLEYWLSKKVTKRQPKFWSKCLDTSLLKED
ncbi:hypothetical protein E2C01_037886 [Portunus trituberculatus]|uniref:Uncharacterized protein n=1 Tax=Portunus trituberculatus TaxID=210409 RepID=A0A5B7FG54_PORTR|nr:hypothetical protein [Portunus trituberculatus]